MAGIFTIDEFRKATEEQKEEALKLVTIKEDLLSWVAWLNSPAGSQIEGTFKLGFHENTRKRGLHPSSIAKKGECLYKHYLDLTGEIPAERSITQRMQFIFDIGTIIHAMLQMHLGHMYGDQFQDEIGMVNKKLRLVGHTDGRFLFSLIRFLLEIKSIKEGGNFGFEKVQDRPFPDNVRQSHCYMFLSDCPFSLLFYFCKNTGEIKEHGVMWDEEIWEGILKEPIYPVLEAVKEKTPPPPKPGYLCRERCSYYHGCEYGRGFKSGARFKTRRSVRR